jgi:hypothetical protein
MTKELTKPLIEPPLTAKRDKNHKPRLSPLQKIMIMADKETGLSALKVSIKHGVSKHTVQRVWKDDQIVARKKEISLIKESMADDLYLTAHRSVKQVNEKLDETTASQAAVITGIMLDKARLLEGKSTQNILNGYFDICNNTPV